MYSSIILQAQRGELGCNDKSVTCRPLKQSKAEAHGSMSSAEMAVLWASTLRQEPNRVKQEDSRKQTPIPLGRLNT